MYSGAGSRTADRSRRFVIATRPRVDFVGVMVSPASTSERLGRRRVPELIVGRYDVAVTHDGAGEKPPRRLVEIRDSRKPNDWTTVLGHDQICSGASDIIHEFETGRFELAGRDVRRCGRNGERCGPTWHVRHPEKVVM